jgi:hypothetical protein
LEKMKPFFPILGNTHALMSDLLCRLF